MGLRPIFENYDSYYLEHRGTPHEADGTPHSGRHPWGSGEMPNQHPHYRTLYDQYNVLYLQYKNSGDTDKEADLHAQIALGLDTNGQASSTIVKSLAAGARASEKAANYYSIQELKASGKGSTAIAKELGMKKESSVRSLNDDFPTGKDAELLTLVEHLEEEVDKKGYIDVGSGTAEVLSKDKSTTASRLQDAINLMKADGYYYGNNHTFQQMGTSKPTTMKIVGPKYEDHSAEGNKRQWLLAQKMVDAAKVSPIRDFETEAVQKGADSADSMYNTSGALWKPVSLDSSRLYIRYDDDPEQSGTLKDGIIELRKGVADISLGDSVYSQVRIAVDDKYYLKGMAVYSDDIPDGYDIVFNSNKNSSKGLDALKKLDINKETGEMSENPFKSSILRNRGQYKYIDPETGEAKQSLINKVREEGDWNDWSRTLAHQFLSKQDTKLISDQLEVTKLEKQLIFEDLQDVTNPVIRSKLMSDFAEECDSAAKYLKATALPGQTTRVLLPLNDQKEDEVYAPGYENGTKVALIRYPHQGVFEIPIKTVNNNNPVGKRNYGELFDAIAVNYNTRVQLSGADCDGDTAVVIPLNGVNVRNDKPIKELTEWLETQDANYAWDHEKYPDSCPFKLMPKARTGTEMGIITNLITDMQVKHGSQTDASRLGTANEDQFTRDLVNAIKYAYLVIDANKHELDYTRAKKDLGIEELHKKYQGSSGGASTILSRAKGQYWIPEKSEYTKIDEDTGAKLDTTKYQYERDENNRIKIDPNTGEKIFKLDENGNKIPATKRMYTWEKNEDGSVKRETKVDPDTGNEKKYNEHALDANGNWLYKEVPATQKTSRMEAVDDARKLMSGSVENDDGTWTYAGTIVERLYANYANSMKTLANEARKASLDTKGYKHSAQAEGVYANEIASLEDKLRQAKENSPKERQAQMAARTIYNTALAESGYSLEESDRKKIRGQQLDKQRARFGASKEAVTFSDKEWEAIQSDACSKTLLESLMKNCKKEELSSKAIEKSRDGNERRLTANVIAWIKRMGNNDSITKEDIADQLGVSVSTVYGVLNGKIKAAS